MTAGEAYGQVKYLRVWLDQHNVAYLLATRRHDELVTTSGGSSRADEMVAALPGQAWWRIFAGPEAHGLRAYG